MTCGAMTTIPSTAWRRRFSTASAMEDRPGRLTLEIAIVYPASRAAFSMPYSVLAGP